MPHSISIPDPHNPVVWITWDREFKSRQAAVRAFREVYGKESIDDEGRVQVITSYEEDEE